MVNTVSSKDVIETKSPLGRVHLVWLDGLRALAALYVMMSHITTTVFVNGNHFRGLTLLLAGPFRYGHSAVGLFIVLSGFSLMLPVIRNGGVLPNGPWKFFGRRAKRILPTYYCALMLSLVLIYFFINKKTGTHWDVSLPVTKTDFLTHIFMLQDIFDITKINHVLWSISVEWRIYFLFPLLVILFHKWGNTKTTLAMLVCSSIVFFAVRHTMLVGIMPAYFFLFVLGMLACQIAIGDQKSMRIIRDQVLWKPIALVLSLVFAVLLYKWRAEWSQTHDFFEDLLDGLLSAILLIVLSKPGENRLRQWISWKPLVFVGTFAYSIYLIHAPLVQIAWQYGVNPLHLGSLMTFIILVVAGVPLIIGLAYLFFLFCERPFLNTKRHESMRELAQDAAISPAP